MRRTKCPADWLRHVLSTNGVVTMEIAYITAIFVTGSRTVLIDLMRKTAPLLKFPNNGRYTFISILLRF